MAIHLLKVGKYFSILVLCLTIADIIGTIVDMVTLGPKYIQRHMDKRALSACCKGKSRDMFYFTPTNPFHNKSPTNWVSLTPKKEGDEWYCGCP